MADPTIEDLKKKQQGLPTRADYEAVLRPGSQLIIDPDTKEVVGVRGSPAVGRQTTAPTLGSMAGGMPAGVNPDDIGRTDASTPTLGGMGGGPQLVAHHRRTQANGGRRQPSQTIKAAAADSRLAQAWAAHSPTRAQQRSQPFRC